MRHEQDDQGFDQIIDRRHTESIKWTCYDEDVLPMWVADMDFRCSDPVLDALRARTEHGIFGYPGEPAELRGRGVKSSFLAFSTFNMRLDLFVSLVNVPTEKCSCGTTVS